jgi:hypothetical protein
MTRLSLIPVVVLAAFSCFGQTEAKPELVDSFGRVSCEDLEAHSDVLASNTSKMEGSRALVIAYPAGDDKSRLTGQFKVILRYFEYFGVPDRVDFRISHADNLGQTEFWIIPTGAVPPPVSGESWVEPTPDVTRPFIYDIEDEIGICSTFVPRKFAELLLANPGSRANVVIEAGSYESALARGFADNTIKTLVEEFKVDRSRIRTFYVRQKAKNSMTYAEYWFVPAKRRPAVSK